MESTRIFIKGLPPTISEDEFKKFFSVKQEITDAKLISERRIGYIGYKTPGDAAKAVKYFNKTYIRMSKIGVELARPISDSTLKVSRKTQREQERESVQARRAAKLEAAAASTELNAGQKRKRAEVDESDPKLKEFLEVMQPPSKANVWVTQNGDEGPPAKIQALEIPDAESDDEYQTVAKKSKKQSSPKPPTTIPAPTLVIEDKSPEVVEEILVNDAVVPDIADDDDWMRSRTNRLLDLMDPEDIAAQTTGTVQLETKPLDDKMPDVEEEIVEEDEEDKPDPVVEAIKTNGRLFVRNLPYTASEDDLRQHFSPYGALEEVHLPLDSAGKSKAMAFIQYASPDAAAEAFHNLDGEPFQGRLVHILPAASKRENVLDEFAIAKLPLKKQRQIKKKAEATSSTFNWNSLFMNQDAVNTSVAKRLGVSKSELFDPTSADSAVKQAIAETSVIQEAKSYFKKNGVDLGTFKYQERSDTAILVKNFPFGTNLDELRKMFEAFGQVLQVLMPPDGTIAIVEMAQPAQAKAAFALAYRRIKDSILYLEKAPKNILGGTRSVSTVVVPDAKGGPKPSTSDLLQPEADAETADTATLYVKNLNFTTTSDGLREAFKPLGGFLSARVKTKTDPKKPSQVLSMGFGFLEFKTKEQAQAAFKAMDGYFLDGHKLSVKASNKGMDAGEERKKADQAKKLSAQRTKIIIKNIAFEVSIKQVRELFVAHGQIRSVRLPKKFDHSTRGFAFVDFTTPHEAENAMDALNGTHLHGRKLVLEFAAADAVDAEEEIERMQKKMSGQTHKVALENLTGHGRKKFNIQGDGDE